MRIEDFERRENEDNKEYFTRVAAMLRELKDAGNDDDFDLAYRNRWMLEMKMRRKWHMEWFTRNYARLLSR